MPLQVRTVVLAVAALAAVGVAVLRSVHAANHVSVAAVADEPLDYGATASQQSATLARLHTPPGLARTACRRPLQGEQATCFHSARPLALDEALFKATVLAIGARPDSLGLPTECVSPRGAAVNRARGWWFRSCHGAAAVGREHLSVFMQSLKVGPPPRSPHLRKVSSYETAFGPGTEVEVSVTGHRLPPGITERILLEGCVKRAC